MILLFGIPSESPLSMVRDALVDLGVEHLMLNQRNFATTHFDFTISNNRISGILTFNAQRYDLENITGVYTRMMDEQSLPEVRSLPLDSPKLQQCRNLHDALLRWIEITPAKVVNRCGSMGSNSSKPYQTQLIAQHGFLVPETLITNDPKQVKEFYEQYGRVIYKSMSSVRSIVQELTLDDLSRLSQIRWCPTQFQKFVDGTNVRVHVVGKETFATQVSTGATDYRYSRQQGSTAELSAIELESDWSEKCVHLAHALDLPFAGIDLKITPDNQVYCFEVNPSPGFSYFEAHTGQPIANAVARYLAAA